MDVMQERRNEHLPDDRYSGLSVPSLLDLIDRSPGSQRSLNNTPGRPDYDPSKGLIDFGKQSDIFATMAAAPPMKPEVSDAPCKPAAVKAAKPYPKSMEQLAADIDAAFKAAGDKKFVASKELKASIEQVLQRHIKGGGNIIEFNAKIDPLIKSENKSIWAFDRGDGKIEVHLLHQHPDKPNTEKDKYPFSPLRIDKLDEHKFTLPTESKEAITARKKEVESRIEKLTPVQAEKELLRHEKALKEIFGTKSPFKKDQEDPYGVVEKLVRYIDQNRFELYALCSKVTDERNKLAKAGEKQNPLITMGNLFQKSAEGTPYKVKGDPFRGRGGGILTLTMGDTHLMTRYAGYLVTPGEDK